MAQPQTPLGEGWPTCGLPAIHLWLHAGGASRSNPIPYLGKQ